MIKIILIKFTLLLLTLTVFSTIVYAEPPILAQAAIVIDFETGEVLYERDAHSPRVPASMTKSMIAFIAYEEIEKGNLSLDTMVRISPFAARMTENNTSLHSHPMPAGTYFSVSDLLHLIMLPSSNRASIALAEHISGSEEAFVERMNETARELGLFTEFTNSHGAYNHYSNAYAMGRLVYEFLHRYPDILRITSKSSETVRGQNVGNTNRHVTSSGRLSGVDGFKTGTLPAAGFCVQSTAVRDGRRIITVVMNAPNNEQRFIDTETLLNFGFSEAARRYTERETAVFIDVVLNGEVLEFEVQPRLIDNRAMIPLIPIFVELGAEVIWDEDKNTIMASYGNNTIKLQSGNNTILINEVPYIIEVPPQVIDYTVFTSTQILNIAFDIMTTWNGEIRAIEIGQAKPIEEVKPATYELDSFLQRFESSMAIYFKNIETGFVYSHNPNRLFFSASIPKAPFALYIYQLAEQGEIDLDSPIPVLSQDFTSGMGEIRYRHPVGTTLTQRELLRLMLHYSDGMATNMLRRIHSVERYRRFVLDLGINPNNKGWALLNYRLTARDAGIYARAIFDYIESDGRYSEEFRANLINNQYPFIISDYEVASRTGWTRGSAWHDMAIVYAPSPYILVVLTERQGWSARDYHDFEEISRMFQDFNNTWFVQKL